MMAGNVSCHYYIVIDGSCHLGNLRVKKSAIAIRTDTQAIYIAPGNVTQGDRMSLGKSRPKLYIAQPVFRQNI
jgi:hypothetical protein